MVQWLGENGVPQGRLVKIRAMQPRLSLHRYTCWRDALSGLCQRSVIHVAGSEVTIVDDNWGPVRKTERRKRRRRKST